jgi:hypothetical protein
MAIVAILIIAFLGVVLFVIRKMYVGNRELKCGAWGAGAFAKRAEFIPEQGDKYCDNALGFMPGWEQSIVAVCPDRFRP